MAFSGATKKLQQVVDMAEETYARLDNLRSQVEDVRERVERTDDRVERIERDLRGQRALLTALAEREGVDVDTVLTEAAIDEAEGDDGPPGVDPDDAALDSGESPADGQDDASSTGE